MADTSIATSKMRPPIGGEVQQRSGYRWLIMLMISLMALITFMDRTNISIAAPLMSKEFGLSKTQMGFVFSAFAWAYAMGHHSGRMDCRQTWPAQDPD